MLDTLVVDLQAQRIDAVYRSVMSAKADVRAVETRLETDPQMAQAQLDALDKQLQKAQDKERRHGR
jgi:flagellar capping protein FliD